MTRQIATLVLEGEWLVAGAPSMIERMLTRVPGVIRAYVSPLVETAYVEYDGDRCSSGDLLRTIEALGMRASLASAHRDPSPRQIS